MSAQIAHRVRFVLCGILSAVDFDIHLVSMLAGVEIIFDDIAVGLIQAVFRNNLGQVAVSVCDYRTITMSIRIMQSAYAQNRAVGLNSDGAILLCHYFRPCQLILQIIKPRSD